MNYADKRGVEFIDNWRRRNCKCKIGVKEMTLENKDGAVRIYKWDKINAELYIIGEKPMTVSKSQELFLKRLKLNYLSFLKKK